MDPIFQFLLEQHGPGPWGRVLDAGTGNHSLRFISALPGVDWTAVTVDPGMEQRVREDPRVPTRGRIVLGDWTREDLLAGETFDVVLADYLLGAMDGFTPYFEDRLLRRLRPHVGGVLMFVGLEPWSGAQDDAQRAFMDLVRFRDACMLMAGQRPYREYPRAWVERALARDGFAVTASRAFPIRITRDTVDRQVKNATSQFCCVAPALRTALEEHAEALRARLHVSCGTAGFAFGSDYALVARPG